MGKSSEHDAQSTSVSIICQTHTRKTRPQERRRSNTKAIAPARTRRSRTRCTDNTLISFSPQEVLLTKSCKRCRILFIQVISHTDRMWSKPQTEDDEVMRHAKPAKEFGNGCWLFVDHGSEAVWQNQTMVEGTHPDRRLLSSPRYLKRSGGKVNTHITSENYNIATLSQCLSSQAIIFSCPRQSSNICK